MTQIAAHQVVVPALARFRAVAPAVGLCLVEGTTAALERQLEQGRLDAAFLHPPLHAPGLSERHLVSAPISRFDIAPDPDGMRPLIRYPRAEAPVVMGAVFRDQALDGDVGSVPEAEANTVLGALCLSEAGFGPCVAPSFYPNRLSSQAFGAAAKTRTGLVLDTVIAYRRLDRRPVLDQLVRAALASPQPPGGDL